MQHSGEMSSSNYGSRLRTNKVVSAVDISGIAGEALAASKSMVADNSKLKGFLPTMPYRQQNLARTRKAVKMIRRPEQNQQQRQNLAE